MLWHCCEKTIYIFRTFIFKSMTFFGVYLFEITSFHQRKSYRFGMANGWVNDHTIWTNYSFKVIIPMVKPTMLNYEQNVGGCLFIATFLPISKECTLWTCLLRQKSQRAANRVSVHDFWDACDGFLLCISSNRWLSRGPLNSCGRGLEFGRGRLHRPNLRNAYTKCTLTQSLLSDQRSVSCRPHKRDKRRFPNPLPNLKILNAITPRFCRILVCNYVRRH